MNYNNFRGKFIVIDGPDGAGKSTQAALLKSALETGGLDVLSLRDPGGTSIGEQIRKILLDPDNEEMQVRCEAFLYMASRAQLYGEKIKPALETGTCVVSDRWLSSTLAYQAVAGKIGMDTVLKMAQAGLERVWPDLTIIVDLPSDIGLQRVGTTRDRMEQKSDDFHQAVRDAFLTITRTVTDGRFLVVDGSGSVEQVHQHILDVLQTL